MNATVERAEAYRLLAAGFGYPEPAELRQAYLEAADARPRLAVFSELASAVDEGMEGEFTRLFATGVAVSPYETAWLRTDKGARLGQIAALYRLFGVRVSESDRELPDHIGTELEFAALLCVKEVLAVTGDERETSGRARRIFTEEHLGRWVPGFAAKLADCAGHPFYRRLAGLLAESLAADLEENGWSASAVATPAAVEAEECLGCPGHVEA